MEEDLKNEIFDTEVMEDERDNYPFHPEDISIDKKVVLVETCMKRITQKTIILSPDFQRHEVWDDVRKSRLIESLMLKIPIPMFYVSADEKNVFTVVDGLQRLSSFRDFLLGRTLIEAGDEKRYRPTMKLQGLEFWTKYNGFTFENLPTYLQNRITETELTFTIINPGTPEEVKRNIFKRINTGGLYLTAQEIRNALYTGKSTVLLNKLSKTNDFLNATDNAVNPKRMDDYDLILRCLAFMIRDKKDYPKNNSMDSFLSDTMQIINAYPNFDTVDMRKLCKRGNVEIDSINKISPEDMESLFIIGMKRSYELFGKNCFRRSYGDKRRSPINKALFEMWGSLLSKISKNEFEKILLNIKAFKDEYHLLLNDVVFQNLISRDSWKYASVQKRFEIIDNLIKKYKTQI